MKNNSRKSPRKPIRQKYEAVPITDPAIQAALDRLFTQAKPVVPPILRAHAKAKSHKEK